jgi:hypothetical protein
VAAALLAYEFGTLLAIAAVVVWIAAWIAGAIDIFRRRDLTMGSRAGWLIILLLLPLVGLFIYFGFSNRTGR